MKSDRLPAKVFPPGAVLQDELSARGWTQTDLAAIMNRPIAAINEIVKGTKQITPETAVELSAAFGTSPELWLNLETRYRLSLAQQNKDAESIETRGKLFSLLPIRDMQKRGWLLKTASATDLSAAVMEYLGIEALDDNVPLAANFRCSADKEPNYPAKVAWVKRAEILARNKECAPYSKEALLGRLDELLSFAERVEDTARVQGWLAKLGIKCVYVPHLAKTCVDGAAFWLDHRPVVALSLRYDRLDCYWFNLCHELGHVINGDGQTYIDMDLDNPESADLSECAEEEEEANEFAKNCLLDKEAYMEFIKRTRPYFYKTKVLAFAERMRRHPSIVVGRLQYDRQVPPQNLNGLHTKVKQYLVGQIDC